MRLNNIFIRILALLILAIVFNENTEGAPRVDDALEVVIKYQELASNEEWLEQSNLIIKEELDGFKDKIIEIPKLKALEEMSSNELYAYVFSNMLAFIKIYTSEIIDTVQESDELIHVVVRDTISFENGETSSARMLTLKYLNNEWKISEAERLRNTANAMHLQILKRGTEKLRAQMLELGKMVSQMSKMQEAGGQNPGTQTTKTQESEIKGPKIEDSKTQ
jgi:hypothetical protein